MSKGTRRIKRISRKKVSDKLLADSFNLKFSPWKKLMAPNTTPSSGSWEQRCNNHYGVRNVKQKFPKKKGVYEFAIGHRRGPEEVVYTGISKNLNERMKEYKCDSSHKKFMDKAMKNGSSIYVRTAQSANPRKVEKAMLNKVNYKYNYKR